jgi:hypothetical protein
MTNHEMFNAKCNDKRNKMYQNMQFVGYDADKEMDTEF